MLALREIQDALYSTPGITPDRAATSRRAALVDGASYDFDVALELIGVAPELATPSTGSIKGICRDALLAIIRHLDVGWSSLITSGTEVLRDRLKSSARNVLQCFDYAKLFDQDDATYAWWDEADAVIRARENATLAETGRNGESLTMQHERQKLSEAGRPDLEPVWVARQNAYAGYDVESFDIVEANARRIFIECKACTRPPLSFHLTPNEVKVAALRREVYVIHLWNLQERDNNGLTQIRASEIQEHLPTNNGSGRWEDVRISWPPT